MASRRKAEELIQAGHVTVNGIVVTELGVRADTSCDTVTVNGKACEPAVTKLYIALHKPEGVITSVSDPYNRPTVMDYIPKESGCYPIGRLDYDTSGLLLLTNDGDLAQLLAHPRNEVSKTYIATVKGIPTNEALAAFQKGLEIDGHTTAPCTIEIVSNKKEPNAKVRIKLKEGRNRQVRKMCEAIGHKVIALRRVAVGHVNLGNLPKGQWRELTKEELRLFKR